MKINTQKMQNLDLDQQFGSSQLSRRYQMSTVGLLDFFNMNQDLSADNSFTVTRDLVRLDPTGTVEHLSNGLRDAGWAVKSERSHISKENSNVYVAKPQTVAYKYDQQGHLIATATLSMSGQKVNTRFQGPLDVYQFFENFLEINAPVEGVIVENLTDFVKNFDGSISPKTIHRLLPSSSGTDGAMMEFYPFIKDATDESMDDFIDSYLDSRSSLLFMIGLPGTGKTTLARSIMRRADDFRLITINSPSVIQSHQFSDYISECYTPTLMLIEDCDTVLGSREGGNQLMSTLLNATDGLVNNRFKMIINTNLAELSSADVAITRPGRCWGQIQFSPLYGNEINVAREAVGLPAIKVKRDQWMTLADALNYGKGGSVFKAGRQGKLNEKLADYIRQNKADRLREIYQSQKTDQEIAEQVLAEVNAATPEGKGVKVTSF